METDDIAAWLTAIYDEQERSTRAALLAITSRLSGYEAEDPFELLHDRDYSAYAFHVPPELVLARIAADRKILALHAPFQGLEPPHPSYCEACGASWPCATVRLLALPHADRLGYNEQWRPIPLP